MTISGYVFDEYDVLPGVNIWEESNRIAVSDQNGKYVIQPSSPISLIRFTFADSMKEKSVIASNLEANPNVIMEWNTMLDTVTVERDIRKKKSVTGVVLGFLAAFLLLTGITSKPE